MDNFVLYSVCIILGGAGACLISRWGKALGLLDKSNDRSSHEGVVPKGGGFGILAAFIVSSFYIDIPITYWIPASFLALFSLLGDKVEISPIIRLPIQFTGAIIALFPPIFSNPSLYPLFSILCVFFLSLLLALQIITISWMGSMELPELPGA